MCQKCGKKKCVREKTESCDESEIKVKYITGPRGCDGRDGIDGSAGRDGTAGVSGNAIFAAADFFALMHGDNAATVATGGDVDFPQNGENIGTDITSTGNDTFNLASIGLYMVQFQVSVTEAGQLVLTLNGIELANSVVGRDTGNSQISGVSLVRTTSANSVLTVRNPTGNAAALTITPLAGGSEPVSAHLVITRLQ